MVNLLNHSIFYRWWNKKRTNVVWTNVLMKRNECLIISALFRVAFLTTTIGVEATYILFQDNKGVPHVSVISVA